MLMTITEWIETKERLPLENKPVIIFAPLEEVRYQNARLIGKMFFGYGRTFKLHEVLCWQYEEELDRPKGVENNGGNKN